MDVEVVYALKKENFKIDEQGNIFCKVDQNNLKVFEIENLVDYEHIVDFIVEKDQQQKN